jgi:uncharacterized membrane protein HdeD (DUF308 family)
MSEPTAVSPRKHVAEVLGSLWWLPLVRGVLLIVLGGYALFHPAMTAIALTQVVGIFVIADGILAIAAGILGETPSRGWTIVRGVIAVLVGVFVFGHPVAVAGITATVVLYVIAFGAITTGVLEIMAALRDRKEMQGEGWLILGGALAILFGMLLLIAPLAFGQLIVRVLGAYAIIFGVSLSILAFRLRNLAEVLGKPER